ncbi:MAG: nuclear transport factor 2 family protein [Thermomicrobiales bacterium]
MLDTLATAEQHAEIKDWFDEWSGYVAAVDFEAARPLFHPEVVGFGTYMEYVRGLDALEQQQWRSIWGTIADFHFATDRLICGVSSDGLQAWGITPWTSTGFHEDGSSYERPGRATVLFVRESSDAPWLAIHTHISLSPGTPQKSHGRPS